MEAEKWQIVGKAKKPVGKAELHSSNSKQGCSGKQGNSGKRNRRHGGRRGCQRGNCVRVKYYSPVVAVTALVQTLPTITDRKSLKWWQECNAILGRVATEVDYKGILAHLGL
jgi:hypothetical protein